jgi:hypothetical protein
MNFCGYAPLKYNKVITFTTLKSQHFNNAANLPVVNQNCQWQFRHLIRTTGIIVQFA